MKYNYAELRENALTEMPEAISALAEWFETFGSCYWNGESYDMDDGLRLVPCCRDDDGDIVIVGWSIRC